MLQGCWCSVFNGKSIICSVHNQCSKLLPVCLPKADNFGGGPGTFLKIFFNFMFKNWDSRQEDWQLFWLSFEHCHNAENTNAPHGWSSVVNPPDWQSTKVIRGSHGFPSSCLVYISAPLLCCTCPAAGVARPLSWAHASCFALGVYFHGVRSLSLLYVDSMISTLFSMIPCISYMI